MVNDIKNPMESCRISQWRCHVLVRVFILSFLLSGCVTDAKQAPVQFVTWDGLEPDKWASVWLVKRHIAPDTKVLIQPVGSPVTAGIPFGMPEADFRRMHGISIFTSLLQGYHLQDEALLQLSDIIQDIEITPWENHKHQDSPVIEQAFRRLQEHFEKRVVPIACYGQFFDQVYTELQRKGRPPDWATLSKLIETDVCKTAGDLIAARDTTPFVRQVDTATVLDLIGAGRKVMFVDAREVAEFDRYHIPGALNLQIRQVTPEVREQFTDADLVIGYCIKDFRGFELARALADVGVAHTAIMKPYGITGWRSLGLPTTGIDGLSESAALEQLQRCAQGVSQCL